MNIKIKLILYLCLVKKNAEPSKCLCENWEPQKNSFINILIIVITKFFITKFNSFVSRLSTPSAIYSNNNNNKCSTLSSYCTPSSNINNNNNNNINNINLMSRKRINLKVEFINLISINTWIHSTITNRE